MPREQITFERFIPTLTSTSAGNMGTTVSTVPVANARPIQAPTLHVGWQKDPGWAQVQLNIPREMLELYLGEEPDQEWLPFYTEVLSRQEINKLIRVLKRARDAAYGKDE